MMSPVQYYGGKGNLLAKLLPLIPYAHTYVEAYAGGACVLLSRRPSPVEVYNDLDGNVVNLFRVLQDPELCEELERRIQWTLYSRVEFRRALGVLREPDSAGLVDRAWAVFVTQNQGFSGKAKSDGEWSRNVTESTRGMAHTCSQWQTRQGMFSVWRDRLMRVQIEQRDALAVIAQFDTPDTVFYLDPPYVAGTRSKGHLDEYAHEVDDAHHAALVALLLDVAGAVVLSGYEHPIYAPLVAAGWNRVEWKTVSHAAGRTRGSGILGKGAALAKAPRTEVLWRNARALQMCGKINPHNPTPNKSWIEAGTQWLNEHPEYFGEPD